MCLFLLLQIASDFFFNQSRRKEGNRTFVEAKSVFYDPHQAHPNSLCLGESQERTKTLEIITKYIINEGSGFQVSSYDIAIAFIMNIRTKENS